MNKIIKLIACIACAAVSFTATTPLSATLWGFSAGIWFAQIFLE